MKRNSILLAIFVFLCGLLLCQSQPVQADDAEKEARAVFVKMVNAARDGNTSEFKSYLLKDDLKEMEQQGMVELMMMMMAGEKPEEFSADIKGDQIDFKKETKSKDNVKESTTVHMIKDGGQWKFGKKKAKE